VNRGIDFPKHQEVRTVTRHRLASHFAVALAIAGSAGPVFAQEPDTPILPGYWESTNTYNFFGDHTKVEKKCIKPADIEKFFSGPSNRHYKCNYPTRIVGDGKAVFKGQCVDKRGRKVDIQASGTYTLTSYHLDARLRTAIVGLPISATGSSIAKRISETCPPGAK
jgi:hypothetical protein